jgi:hypothetical protein
MLVSGLELVLVLEWGLELSLVLELVIRLGRAGVGVGSLGVMLRLGELVIVMKHELKLVCFVDCRLFGWRNFSTRSR